jgi:hypothetical protein
MAVLSDEKMSHLAHVILGALKSDRTVRMMVDEAALLRTIKRVLSAETAEEERTDEIVRARLRSYARPPVEGSPEWDVLYRKFFDEELRKRHRT